MEFLKSLLDPQKSSLHGAADVQEQRPQTKHHSNISTISESVIRHFVYQLILILIRHFSCLCLQMSLMKRRKLVISNY